jgi:hypothetical protein
MHIKKFSKHVSRKLASFPRRVLTLQGVQKDKSFCNLVEN